LRVTYVCLQPREGAGASDRHVAGIVRGLKSMGHAVDLIELRSAHSNLWMRALHGLWVQLIAVRRVRAADVVWLRMHPVGAVTVALLGRHQHLVVEVNGVEEDFYAAHPQVRQRARLLRGLLRFQLRRAELLFPVTEGLAEHLRSEYADSSIHVVPNAVDPDQFLPDLEKPRGLPAVYAIYFGSLEVWQGIDLALAAAEDTAWPKGLPLVVVGDGPERQRVEAVRLRSPGRIVYVGPVATGSIPAYVANASVSLVPKRYHAPRVGQSPLKLYESLACGVPVIATDLPGSSDITDLQPFIHIVAPAANSIAEAVGTVCRDTAARQVQARAARAAVLNAHTWRHRAALAMRAITSLDH
jgi:glycosyltransferase involved in cell wall biosynthesis